MSTARLLVSATRKSSGKTMVSVGLVAALRRRGLSVQAFKKGPDYIDPMWLGRAAGRPCCNLDPHIAGWDEVRSAFAHRAAAADVALVEGNLGLHDGLAEDGSDSNAALALRLGLPVVLVVDARGMTRGVAPLVLGQQAFDPGVRFAGVVLNRVGGARHEAKLRAVIERYTTVPVLGAIAEDPRLTVVERHLGLIPANEADAPERTIEQLADTVRASVDLDRLLAIVAAPAAGGGAADAAAGLPVTAARVAPAAPRLRIGLARDEAFGFYYADDLEALEAAGAELVPFDTLRDTRLPEVDAVFIGGGFPEAHAARLQANAALRRALRAAIEDGLPVYAECGGLMYLARSIQWHGARFDMVGALPGDVVMHPRAVGRGYVQLEETGDGPWPGRADGPVRAHEFHHSSLENLPPGQRYAWRVKRGHGIDGASDGLVVRNVLASYAHLRAVGGHRWPERFVAFARSVAQSRRAATTESTA